MVKHDALLRVFWPRDIVSPGVSGVLVGWQNSASDLLIVSILENADSRAVEGALRSGNCFRGSPYPFDRITERCGRLQLQVLGYLNPQDSPQTTYGNKLLIVYTRQGHSIPKVHSFPNPEISAVQFILFKRPHPVQMQYMSLEPIYLALTQNQEKMAIQGLDTDDLVAQEDLENLRTQSLARKLQQHSIVNFPLTAKDMALPIIVNQINCCFEINALLQRNTDLVRKGRRSLRFSERIVSSASEIWASIRSASAFIFAETIFPLAAKFFIYILMALRIMSEVLVRVIGWRLGSYRMALKDVSATAQQVDLRLQQLCYWPIQYLALRERRNNWRSITDNHTEYIRFFNSIWLVANDVIIGVAIGSYILQNGDMLTIRVNDLVETWSTSGLHQSISWLTRNPGGLKLNNELAQFLGNLFQWIIEYWASSMRTLEPMFPQMIRFIAFASFGGATLPIALCSDLASILTLHVHCFYVASARIYHWQLLTIYSLFHLFRGKKRNILRNRIDSCDYELDQLLLGTILFTLLSFLLPTVLVFYSTFAVARSAIIVLKAILDTALAALNHFPLFALMLRIKDSGRLPEGGINFELQHSPSTIIIQDSESCTTASVSLKSTPLPIKAIFHEYSEFGNRIRKHYLSSNFLSSFATGRFVPSLHRGNLYGLQYSMLPARRIGIKELWKRLSSATKTPETGLNDAWREPSSSSTTRRVQS